jgi:hypothetical protein
VYVHDTYIDFRYLIFRRTGETPVAPQAILTCKTALA